MSHFEVIPLTIGVEAEDGRFLEVIPRNTPVPFHIRCDFFTSDNDQREMTFAVSGYCFVLKLLLFNLIALH